MRLLAANPFVHAYLQSDLFGKLIFLSLFALSVLSWTFLVSRYWVLVQVRIKSSQFLSQFSEKDPLRLQFSKPVGKQVPHVLFEVYKSLKIRALHMSHRRSSLPVEEQSLRAMDLDLLDAEVHAEMKRQIKRLEKHLFLLPMIVTLGPFMGLLGTVWGSLLAISKVASQGASGDGEAMLAGLSLALATTVIGLLVAIPALVGYNYLKYMLKDLREEMEDFAHRLLVSVELHFQGKEDATKIPSVF